MIITNKNLFPGIDFIREFAMDITNYVYDEATVYSFEFTQSYFYLN